MINIVKDVSALTNISEKHINKVIDVIKCSILDGLVENRIIENTDNTLDVDLGIGVLTIRYSNDEIGFKFIPDAKLREDIVSVVKDKNTDILKTKLDENIINKMTSTYKDLLY